jgi:hypothetical protein
MSDESIDKIVKAINGVRSTLFWVCVWMALTYFLK